MPFDEDDIDNMDADGLDRELKKFKTQFVRYNRNMRDVYQVKITPDRQGAYNPDSGYCLSNGTHIDLRTWKHVIFWTQGSNHQHTLSTDEFKALRKAQAAFANTQEICDAQLQQHIKTLKGLYPGRFGVAPKAMSAGKKKELLKQCLKFSAELEDLDASQQELVSRMASPLKGAERPANYAPPSQRVARFYSVPMKVEKRHLRGLQKDSQAWQDFAEAVYRVLADDPENVVALRARTVIQQENNQAGVQVSDKGRATMAKVINYFRKYYAQINPKAVSFADDVVQAIQEPGSNFDWLEEFLNKTVIPAAVNDFSQGRYHALSGVMSKQPLSVQLVDFIKTVRKDRSRQRFSSETYIEVDKIVQFMGGGKTFEMNLIGDLKNPRLKTGALKQDAAKRLLKEAAEKIHVQVTAKAQQEAPRGSFEQHKRGKQKLSAIAEEACGASAVATTAVRTVKVKA